MRTDSAKRNNAFIFFIIINIFTKKESEKAIVED